MRCLAENQIIREDVMRDVEQDVKQQDDILNDLRTFGTDQDRVAEISRAFDLLIDNLDQVESDFCGVDCCQNRDP